MWILFSVVVGLTAVFGFLGPVSANSLSAGDVLVADWASGTIRQFSSTGADLGVFATVATTSSTSSLVPWSLTSDSAMNVYLSTTYGVIFKGDGGFPSPSEGKPVAAGVIKFSSNGTRMLDVSLSAPGFTTGGGIAALGNGQVVVGNYFSSAGAMIVDASGTGSTSIYDHVILGNLGAREVPAANLGLIKRGVNGDLWIAGQGFSQTGDVAHISLTSLTNIGNLPTGIPHNAGADGLAIANDGTIYVGNRGVADANGNRPNLRIDRWSSTGDFLGTFAVLTMSGTASGFDLAFDLDAQGNLYVLNTLTGELHKFSSTGADLGVVASGFGGFGDVMVVGRAVGVPEARFLRQLMPRLPREIKLGLGLHEKTTNALQHATAWGGATILRAVQLPVRQRGVYLDLPSVTMKVAEVCSGLHVTTFLLVLAVAVACVIPVSLTLKLALIAAAIPVAIEVNAIRVALNGLGLELVGELRAAALFPEWKEWLGLTTTAFAVLQVLWLGRRLPRAA